MSSLVTLGETMGLLVAREPGPLPHVSTLQLRMAGAESNVAIGAQRLGVPSTWIGRLGRDGIGELIERELRAEGVRPHITNVAAPTGLMIKTARTSDITQVSYYRANSAGSQLCSDDIDEATIAAADVLHVSGITPALGLGPAGAVNTAIEIARANGVTVSLDLNYRAALWDVAIARPILRELVKLSDVVFAGIEEASIIVPTAEPQQMARELSTLGPTQVIVKLGHLGSVALVDGHSHTCGVHKVRVVDSVGAGDAFVAGYL
ncbi:MAG: sugar kinase, partial [Actinomycetota bacterium]|nr:sugar kinase [Actinomycetota bacterium]